MAEQYEEAQVLTELLKNSPQFQRFYKAKRPKISEPTAWMRDTSLPIGVNAQATSDLNQHFHIISLRDIPVALEDAFTIAEELEHCVYDEEGFPGTAPTESRFHRLTATLNSMLGDPIAHQRLKEFGFDLRTHYEKETLESRRQIENLMEPTRREDVFLWMVNYAADALEFGTMGDGASDFQNWFDSKFPRIAEKAKKLLAMINRIGYDTPDKQAKLLQELARRYNLYPFIKILIRSK
jgi:hypothetical protein